MAYDFAYLFDFRGGMNSSSSPDNLLDYESQLMRNVDLSARGGFKRRHGISEHKDIGAYQRIDRLIEFEYLKGESRILQKLALADGNLIDVATGTVLKSGLGRSLDYEIYKDKIYILSNGLFIVYDGTSVSDVTSTITNSLLDKVKKCRYIEQKGERLFASGNPEDPNALYFSEVGKPSDWSGESGNPIMAISDDADKVTGIKEFHGALLVFKSRSVYAWVGNDPLTDVVFQRLNVQSGTISSRTIVYLNNSLIYLGEDGVYALLGTYKDVISTKKVSNNIDELISKIKCTDPLYDNSPCAIYHDGKYMLSVATSNDRVNDKVYVLFTDVYNDAGGELEPWVVYDGWNISDFLHSVDGNLYSASSVSGKIHIHDEGLNDLGNGIEVEVLTRPLAVGAPFHNKKFRRGYISFRQFETINTNVNVDFQVDYNIKTVQSLSPDESLVWDYRNWDEGKWDFSEFITRKFDIRERGKRLTIRFYDNSINSELVIYGVAVEYKVKKPDRE